MHDAGGQEVAGMMSLKTDDGRTVKRVVKGKYEIVGDPTIRIASDDPRAP
jgi:hypothetical protein